MGLHQIVTTEMNLSHASIGDILDPPVSHLFIIQVWAARSATWLEMHLYSYGSHH